MMAHTGVAPEHGDRLYDICIVGAGIAGITLAMELRNTPLDVCLLEGGSLSSDPASQALYAGTIEGNYGIDLDECRARCLGGSSVLWPGTCTPLDPLDFERRDWVYDGEWPFGYDDVAAYYPRAAAYCSLSSSMFIPDGGLRDSVLPLDPSIWTTRRAQVSTAPRFGERYADDLRSAPNISVLLGANVVRVVCEQDGTRVRHVMVQPLAGRPFAVRARTFVLALGGVENARLMLVSNDVHPEGIGNGNDLLGRFFMDHPVICTVLLDAEPTEMLAAYAYPPNGEDTGMNYLQLQSAYVHAHRTTNVRVQLSPATKVEMSEALFSYSYMRLCLRRHRWPHVPVRQLARMAAGSQMLGTHFVSRLGGPGQAPTTRQRDRVRVSLMCEQLPNAANRVTLATGSDALGVPRARLAWHMGEDEQLRARRAIDLLGESLREAGIGRVRNLAADPDRPFEERLAFGNHAIGTTRASHDPRTGVVDGNCRVFGVDNLLIAGSSVFPTSGHLPPTFTIVALAIRMAEHLARQAGHPPPRLAVPSKAG